jgi:hypothetical protein
LSYGVRNVPVVAKGKDYVFGQNLEDVAKFVGLQGTGHKPLSPPELIQRWTTILRTAQRIIRQMPDDKITGNVIDNRERTIRFLSFHVFRIGEAFLECARDGQDYGVQLANVPPADGAYMTGGQIAQYGESTIEHLQQWWASLADKSCTAKVTTYYGVQPMSQLLERSTWHSTQHVRQLTAVLERFGITPNGPLKPEDLAGLPLPERLWE